MVALLLNMTDIYFPKLHFLYVVSARFPFLLLSLRGLSELPLESDFPVQTLLSPELGFTFSWFKLPAYIWLALNRAHYHCVS